MRALSSHWNCLVLAAATLAGCGLIIVAAPSAKADISPPLLPMTFSVAIVSVPLSPEQAEIKRLKTRNRRLEALVSVLRERADKH